MPVSKLTDFHLVRYGQGTTYKLRLKSHADLNLEDIPKGTRNWTL